MIRVVLEDYGIRKSKERIQTKLKTGSIIPAYNLVRNVSHLFLKGIAEIDNYIKRITSSGICAMLPSSFFYF